MKGKTACPFDADNAELPDGWLEAMADDFPTIDLKAEFKNFVNYHVAKGSRYMNWKAAFRNWLTNAVKFQARDSARRGVPAGRDESKYLPNSRFKQRIAQSDAARARMNNTLGQAWRYSDRNSVAGVSVDVVWATINGDANMPAGTGRLASIMQGARNLAVAGKLGSAVISSFSDIPSYWVALGVNGINPLRSSFSLISMFSMSDREFAARAGIMADSISGSLGRFYEDNVGNGATAIMAEMTIRASGLNFWTQGIRQAFGLNLMAATGKLVKKADWDHLEAYDRMRLENHGITQTDWNILRLAKTERYRECDFITRESIENISDADLEAAGFTVGQRDLALSKYLGFLANESYMASLEANAITRAAQSRGYQKGTIDGEFWRSVMLFKSFPLGMVTQHFQRSHDLWVSGHKADATALSAQAFLARSRCRRPICSLDEIFRIR